MSRDDVCSAFLDTLPFDPYPFQEEAILAWFEEEQGLLVTAPTGMGRSPLRSAQGYSSSRGQLRSRALRECRAAA